MYYILFYDMVLSDIVRSFVIVFDVCQGKVWNSPVLCRMELDFIVCHGMVWYYIA